jgi:hypothetical protein
MDESEGQKTEVQDSMRENESIQFMRKQSEELAQRIGKVRFSWSKLTVLGLLGLFIPIMAVLFGNKILMEKNDYKVDSEYVKEVQKYFPKKIIKTPEDADIAIDECIDDFATAQDKNSDTVKYCSETGALTKKKTNHDSNIYAIFLLAIVGSILAVLFFPMAYLLWINFYRTLLGRERNRIEYRIIQTKAQQLQDQIGQDFFTTLVKINFKYLDQYYFQTQEQANKSFMLSVYAAIGGAIIIAIGILHLIFGSNANVSYLTTSSGIISQFIAAVFFYLYNKTVLKMGEYHQKLVLTQNIGISLKITENLPNQERVQAQQLLVAQLTNNINGHLSSSQPV